VRPSAAPAPRRCRARPPPARWPTRVRRVSPRPVSAAAAPPGAEPGDATPSAARTWRASSSPQASAPRRAAGPVSGRAVPRRSPSMRCRPPPRRPGRPERSETGPRGRPSATAGSSGGTRTMDPPGPGEAERPRRRRGLAGESRRVKSCPRPAWPRGQRFDRWSSGGTAPGRLPMRAAGPKGGPTGGVNAIGGRSPTGTPGRCRSAVRAPLGADADRAPKGRRPRRLAAERGRPTRLRRSDR
jgi:hypothetical protein